MALSAYRDMITVGGIDPFPRGVFISWDYQEVYGVVTVGLQVQVVRLKAEQVEALAESGHPELVRARNATRK